MFIKRPTHPIMVRFRAGRVTKPRAITVAGLKMGPEEGLGSSLSLVTGVKSECLHLGGGEGQRLELQMQWGCQRRVCAASFLPCKP